MQPEELSASEIINIIDKSDCDKKDEDVPEEASPRKKSC